MDYVTFATQVLGGVIAAFVAGGLVRPSALGVLGNVITGVVGGGLGGLVLAQYFRLAPAGHADGTVAEPFAVILQIASGAAGGAALAILTGLLTNFCRR